MITGLRRGDKHNEVAMGDENKTKKYRKFKHFYEINVQFHSYTK